MKFFAAIAVAIGAVLFYEAGFDVDRLPMTLVWFAVATTGVIWALAKI
ncbi:hypothetical protein GGD81_001597 [Rhodobium orientis]|nr:hypothetical protein [Rhodobium orientis]MBB4302567.1 hypothetical protein [Rhodobium orientis]